MGTWGDSVLENDDATDFLEELTDSRNRWQTVRDALAKVSGLGYVETPESINALTAAEIIAAANGHAHAALEKSLASWAQRYPPKDLGTLAISAVEAIQRIEGRQSELAELWSHSSDEPKWKAQLIDLIHRIRHPRKSGTSSTTPAKRVRGKPGDVFQVQLPNGRYAYGRLCERHHFYIYSEHTDLAGRPPIGSRKFQFYGFGLDRQIAEGVCPIVGKDPFGPGESSAVPRYYWGFPPLLTMLDGDRQRKVTVKECIGVERMTAYDLDGLIERILEGSETLELSFTELGIKSQ
jgi:hypothetical protein